MWKHRLAVPVLLGLSLAAPLYGAPPAIAAAEDAQPSAIAPGMARVWFLRPSSATLYNGAAPVVCANGAAVGEIPPNSDFYRDFPAGNYRFTVQSYGQPTPQADAVQLAPGTQTYLHIEWVPTWEVGSPEGIGSDAYTFAVLPISPELAEAYLPSLSYLGQH